MNKKCIHHNSNLIFITLKILALMMLITIISSCSFHRTMLGKARQEVHNVSIIELISKPHFFDNQPVRVIAIAGFDFQFESWSAIYTTKEDMKHDTYSYIALKSFEPGLIDDKKLLGSLNGKFILIEGVFKAITRNSIDLNDEEISFCFRGCGAVGYIEEINRIYEWGL